MPSYTTVNFRSELTRDMQPISRDRLLQIKFDKSYSNHSIAAKVIEEILAEDWSSGSTLNDAAEHLRGWNLATNAGNRHAALAAPSDSCSDGEQPKTISVSETSEIRKCGFIDILFYLWERCPRCCHITKSASNVCFGSQAALQDSTIPTAALGCEAVSQLR